jgi:hypothetical protein
LRPFNISSGTIRLDGGRTPKGYKLSAFKDAFERYPPDFAATTPQVTDTAGYSENLSATTAELVADRKSPKATATAGCGVVADKKRGYGKTDAYEPDPADLRVARNIETIGAGDAEERLAIQTEDEMLDIPSFLDRRPQKRLPDGSGP